MAKLYTVKLTLDELMLIDGKSNEEVQKIIEQAKFENSFGLDDFSNEILRKAVENGKIEWSSCKISSCQFCEKNRVIIHLQGLQDITEKVKLIIEDHLNILALNLSVVLLYLMEFLEFVLIVGIINLFLKYINISSIMI